MNLVCQIMSNFIQKQYETHLCHKRHTLYQKQPIILNLRNELLYYQKSIKKRLT